MKQVFKYIRGEDPQGCTWRIWRHPAWFALAFVGLAATVLLTLAGRLGGWFWWLDLWANFRFHYFAAGLLLALMFVTVRRWTMVVIALAIAFVNAPPNVPPAKGQIGVKAVGSMDPGLKIVTFNVLKTNRSYHAVRGFLRREAADIIILQEINAAWESELMALSTAFPYRFIRASESFYGLALLSKIPWESVEFLPFAETDGTPVIKARFRIAGRSLTFLGVKTFPPTSGARSRRRDQQLLRLGDLANEIEGPLIMAGDLNATTWSHGFGGFRRNSRKQQWNSGGHGASWPALLGWAGIKIDHIMVNSELRMLRQSTGPKIGSDHLPVIAVLGM